MYVVRKIKRSRWECTLGIDNYLRILADPVFDLKTKDNDLSLWYCETKADICKAILAIHSNAQRIDGVDVVWIDIDVFEEQDIPLKQTDGDTTFSRLVHNHRDVKNMTIELLGKVALLICQAINAGQCMSLTSGELKELFCKALDDGTILREEIREQLVNKLF